jgi:hypothetical protein
MDQSFIAGISNLLRTSLAGAAHDARIGTRRDARAGPCGASSNGIDRYDAGGGGVRG